MYLVLEGETEIIKSEDPGGEVVRLHHGDYFGELSPMLKLPRSANARAVVPTRVRGVSGPEFQQQMRAGTLADLADENE